MPTVLTNVNRDAKVSRLEVFGPIVCISPFDTLDDARNEAISMPVPLAYVRKPWGQAFFIRKSSLSYVILYTYKHILTIREYM